MRTGRTIFHVKRARLIVAPRLSVIPMVAEVAIHFRENHHGDAGRKAAAVELEAEDLRLRESMEGEIQEPLKVTPAGKKGHFLVWDGRHRLSSNHATLPCVRISLEEAENIIATSIAGRRQWTDSMRAWAGIKLHPETALANRGKGRPSKKPHSVRFFTIAALSRKFGVSEPLMSLACELYREFYTPAGVQTKLGEVCEMSIWGGAGLGGVKAGLGAVDAGNGPGESRKPSSLTGVETALNSLLSRIRNYDEWTMVHKIQFEKAWKERFTALPIEVRRVIAETVKTTPWDQEPTEAKPAKAPKPARKSA